MMDGTAEEAQILFHGMFDTINEMIQEGTYAQGHNIGQCVHEIVSSLLATCWFSFNPNYFLTLQIFEELMNSYPFDVFSYNLLREVAVMNFLLLSSVV